MLFTKIMGPAVSLVLWGGAAAADALFTPPLVAEGDRLLDCYLANVGQVQRKVKIAVLDAKGKAVVGPLAVTLAPGEEKVARAEAELLGRYCKFTVPSQKSEYRASVLVFQPGAGAISALPAN